VFHKGEPEPALGCRSLYQPRGKVLGGSSSINGLGFIRGHARDFERWGVEDTEGWSYREVLPYFKRLESYAKKIHSSSTAGTVLLAGGQDAFASGDFDSRLMGMVKLGGTEDGFLNDKKEPVFNSEGQGERALERLKEIVPYCLRGFENFDYPDGSSALQSGAVGMMTTWSDTVVGIEDGPLKGKFGYALMPTDKFQQQAVAGNQIYISKFSENQQDAYRFLAWMTEGDGYRDFRKDGEASLVLQSDIDLPDIADKVPMLAAFKQFKPRGTSAIPCQFFQLNNAVEAQRALYEELVSGLLGRKSTKQAMADAEKRVADIAKK
jgi:multiple sugar transport system substrate-binding protein